MIELSVPARNVNGFNLPIEIKSFNLDHKIKQGVIQNTFKTVILKG